MLVSMGVFWESGESGGERAEIWVDIVGDVEAESAEPFSTRYVTFTLWFTD